MMIQNTWLTMPVLLMKKPNHRLSLSGETVEILNALNIAKGQNPKILSLTVNANTSLTNLSDISLIGYKSSLEVNYFDLDVHSRLSLSILSRVLIDAYSIYTLKQ